MRDGSYYFLNQHNARSLIDHEMISYCVMRTSCNRNRTVAEFITITNLLISPKMLQQSLMYLLTEEHTAYCEQLSEITSNCSSTNTNQTADNWDLKEHFLQVNFGLHLSQCTIRFPRQHHLISVFPAGYERNCTTVPLLVHINVTWTWQVIIAVFLAWKVWISILHKRSVIINQKWALKWNKSEGMQFQASHIFLLQGLRLKYWSEIIAQKKKALKDIRCCAFLYVQSTRRTI